MGENDTKKFDLTPSGRPSILRGAKYQRGFIIRQDQILSLLHDTQPNLPIPSDAIPQGLGIKDEGDSSEIQFYFTSVAAPNEHCLAMKPHLFFKILKDLAHGLIPGDGEMDGIEISTRFTVIMLRIKSSHWPPTMESKMPLYHLRYEYGKLLLVDPSMALESEEMNRRIKVTDTWMN